MERFPLKIPASVWLPSLKVLKMVELRSENVDSALKLILGSPVLEYLDILLGPAFESREVLNISVPTLKRLKVWFW